MKTRVFLSNYPSPLIICSTQSIPNRLNAYSQFISSYKSVTIKLMAETFGVTTPFIEDEIYRFITQGLLKVKIDKVAIKGSKSCTFAKGTRPQPPPETHADLGVGLGHVPFCDVHNLLLLAMVIETIDNRADLKSVL